MSETTEPNAPVEAGGARRRGRRIAQAIYYSAMVCVALGSLYQISRQVFASPDPSSSPYKTCQEGLSALHASLSEGREVANQHAHKTSPGSELPLRQFRLKVDQSWRHRQAVSAACRHDAKSMTALAAIEDLRYAEEHRVRSRSNAIIPLRIAAERALQGATASP